MYSTIRSHGTKSHMLGRKLPSGSSKTKQLVPVYLDLPLFLKSHGATCDPACVILYHVTESWNTMKPILLKLYDERNRGLRVTKNSQNFKTLN